MTEQSFNCSELQNNLCWHQMFDAQVKKKPNAVAVIFENENLTYQQLNCYANQLAHYLQKLNIGPNVPVSIYMENSLYLPIAILGIFKAGGACVHLQLEFPLEQLSFMLDDSQSSVLLTHSQFITKIPQHKHKINIIYIDESWNILNQESAEKPINQITVNNLAHIIYTSGSTGKPKGVMVTHNSYCGKFWDSSVFQITENDRRLILSNIFYFYRLFWALGFGAQGIIVPQGKHKDSAYLVKVIAEKKITDVGFVPSMLERFLEEDELDKCRYLRRIHCSGETLPLTLKNIFFQRLPDTLLQNGYGITEVVSPCFIASWNCKQEDNNSIVPIGRPSNSGKVYLLDSYLQPVPNGVVGELYIDSPCLAQGYINQPELTAKKFLPNPFSNDPKARIFKTGDLARYLPDGNLELIGRIDNQVKIRGFRVELEGIETILLQYPSVQKAVITVQGDELSDKHLIAYIVSNQRQNTTPSELRRFLKERLPDYMIPSDFIMLEVLPLNSNSKIDRRALPTATNYVSSESKKNFIIPQNDLERQLAMIWEKVLKVKPIGIHDNFFDVGGHSLLAVKLLSKIEKELGKSLSLRTLFQASTIAQQADILRRGEDHYVSWRTLQIIQPQGTQLPLFFIGSTDYARALAPLLGIDQPIYGLNLFGLQPTDGTTFSLKVPGIAQQYLKDIQTIQSKGPYLLIGYCADTKVALEMAQQLQASGQKVGLLAFIDVNWQLPRRFVGIHYLWHHLLEFGPGDLLHRTQRKLKFIWHSSVLSLNRLRNRYHRDTGQALSLESQHKLLFTNFLKALANYSPQSYSGHITLFLSREWHLKYLPTLNQDRFAKDGVEVYEIPGYHDTLFIEPQVSILGKQLKKLLYNINQSFE